ncbi:unnamed protein product [Rotaria sordida]|uniref:Radical SAM core domain-containing protein n=1 Tax=Rotaria sordida TaxID=392033 RepID=A0A818ZIQ0_9BILA|nr:unnamed protein product [Rotaria sordida]
MYNKQPIPLSVNYHLTRACNYRCKFCFHTYLTNDHLPLDEAKREKCHMATSIVSNGSLISEKWFKIYSKYLDIFAIACDSLDDECNRQAG